VAVRRGGGHAGGRRFDSVVSEHAILPGCRNDGATGPRLRGDGTDGGRNGARNWIGVIVRARDRGKVVLTNTHVIWGATEVRVELFGGTVVQATVADDDATLDLATLRLPINALKDTPALTFGDDERLQPGEPLVSIGSPAGIPHVVSVGVFSARGKKPGSQQNGPSTDCLFTDPVLSPGTSGGPVLNLEGDVIGVNSGQAGQTSGLGVIIPARLARRLLGS
jgi:serine protease Do